MKLSYETIKHNLSLYEEARKTFPILKKYEQREITRTDLGLFKLSSFGEFYDFMEVLKNKGFNPVDFVTFKDLKKQIVDNTPNERFKSLISNMSKPKFIKLISSDGDKFDRLINGRWISKPKANRRGRISYGRRSNEKVDGLSICFTQIINFVIINELDVYEGRTLSRNPFVEQNSKIKWYLEKLSFEDVPKAELDITNSLVSNLIDMIEDTKLNFRKFNVDFINNSISSKIKKMMLISEGTSIKCCEDVFSNYSTNRKILTSGNYYEVKGSYISGGMLQVKVTDDMGHPANLPFKHFEDVQLKRNNLLDDLLGL
jgi:hypothetical protein